MNAPVQIKNEDVTARLRRLAAREGVSMTDLVDQMSREREARLSDSFEAEVQRKIAAANEIVRHFQALPILGPIPTDDDLYDQDGLPK
ncbi:hypothetical protein BH09PSE1_BH09PSE1_10820 [soil metagenome]